MKKLVLAVAAVVAATVPMAAFAAPPKTHTARAKTPTHDTMTVGHNAYTSGVVAAYAPDTRMLKLSAGEQFKIAAAVTSPAYKAGDKVTVRWQMKDGARVADEVQVK